MTLDQVEARIDIARLIARANLTERQLRILNQRFGLAGETMTLQEIGVEDGVTRETIRRIEAKAVRKLQRAASLLQLIEYKKTPVRELRNIEPAASIPVPAPPLSDVHAPAGQVTLNCDTPGCDRRFVSKVGHDGGLIPADVITSLRSRAAELASWSHANGKDYCRICAVKLGLRYKQ